MLRKANGTMGENLAADRREGTENTPKPVWRSNADPNRFWSPDSGEIGKLDDLKIIPTGNSRRTRLAKPRAKYVLLEKDRFGTRQVAYFVPSDASVEIEAQLRAPSPSEVRRIAKFERKYVDWNAAKPDVCQAMFEMNRYAKHRSCSADHRKTIYDLKNRLIHLLHESGHCTKAWLHRRRLPAKPCRACHGSGTGLMGDFGTDGDMMCRGCDGTGIYAEEVELEFVCFRFEIGSQTYTWHQPRENIRFPVDIVASEDDRMSPTEVRPISLPTRKFAEMKALIRWVLDRSRST